MQYFLLFIALVFSVSVTSFPDNFHFECFSNGTAGAGIEGDKLARGWRSEAETRTPHDFGRGSAITESADGLSATGTLTWFSNNKTSDFSVTLDPAKLDVSAKYTGVDGTAYTFDMCRFGV